MQTSLPKAKRFKNGAEQEFLECAQSLGWEVTKRGWPDFVCFKGNAMMVVEVKAHRGRHLRHYQRRVMKFLARRGVACYRWTPDGRFDKLYLNEPDC